MEGALHEDFFWVGLMAPSHYFTCAFKLQITMQVSSKTLYALHEFYWISRLYQASTLSVGRNPTINQWNGVSEHEDIQL